MLTIELVFNITPLVFSKYGIQFLEQMNIDLILILSIFSYSSTSNLSIGVLEEIPALFIKMSIFPYLFAIF